MGAIGIGSQQAYARTRGAAIAEVVDVVQTIAQDGQLLQLSAELVRRASSGTVSPEETAKELSRESQDVASLLERAPEALRHVVIFILLAAIQIVAGQLLAESLDHSATPGDVERIVRHSERDQERNMRTEIQRAVEHALREYEREHPSDPALAGSKSDPEDASPTKKQP